MKKIIVIGCPGSGKSTLSIALSQATGLPLYHLDLLYWNVDKTTVERSVFLQRLQPILEKDEWIIDGNYGATMELRIAACDTVIFLDYPTELCLEGIRARRGKPRPDMPWVEKEGEEDAEFINSVLRYNDTNRPRVLERLKKHPEKTVIILKSRAETDRFLKCISSTLPNL